MFQKETSKVHLYEFKIFVFLSPTFKLLPVDLDNSKVMKHSSFENEQKHIARL